MLIKKFKGSFPESKILPAAISASANAKTTVGWCSMAATPIAIKVFFSSA
jgi:hypothetical protein